MKSLKATGNQISVSENQISILESSKTYIPSFSEKLSTIGLYPLKPLSLEIIQINLGKMCNQTCVHCHVDAGPDRKEIMTKDTMLLCLEVIKNSSAHTIDLTGGAPEMNPHFQWFVEQISKLEKKTIVRSNLTILVSNKKYKTFPEFFKTHRITVISSLPCYTKENTDYQRGKGVFDRSIEALKRLNEMGYGKEESGLELHLVYNPGGAFLPPPQEKLEREYKQELYERFGIVFNRLYTLTNLPISRFLEHLLIRGEYEKYMEVLANAFNPAAAKGVMCRNTISVGWDGFLYDCDFNQMLEMKIQKPYPQHISEFNQKIISERSIVTHQHCYGCTAGAGSSCQGTIIK